MSVKQILRDLVRAIDKNITEVSGDKTWQKAAISLFRNGGIHRDPREQDSNTQLAVDYTFLINNIAKHRDLLIKYGIGIDPDERNKQMIKLTARRVGFKLPEGSSPSGTGAR